MSEARLFNRLCLQAIFVALCLGCIVVRLIPLNTEPGGWPGPDVMLCLALAYAIRRPDLVPIWLVVPLFLFADMVLMHAPGLWTALVVVAVEALRKRNRRTRSWSPQLEFCIVGIIVAGLIAAHWLGLGVMLVRQPGLLAQLAQLPATMIAYPVVMLLCYHGLNIRKRPLPEGFGRGARI